MRIFLKGCWGCDGGAGGEDFDEKAEALLVLMCRWEIELVRRSMAVAPKRFDLLGNILLKHRELCFIFLERL